jgi:DNA-binding response OmpR family regulator
MNESNRASSAVRGARAPAKILVVEDDEILIDLLGYGLAHSGFIPFVARSTPQALDLFASESPDLVVLDIGLGAWNGLDLLREIRQRSNLPVIIATGEATDEGDRVRGLEMGADDYVIKPFGYLELIARIDAHLRRVRGAEDQSLLRVGPFELDSARYSVKKGRRALQLTGIEFRLLRHLMLNAGSIVSTAELLQEVWGYNEDESTDVVRVALHRLRRKVEDDPSHPQFIQSVPGVGVILRVPGR